MINFLSPTMRFHSWCRRHREWLRIGLVIVALLFPATILTAAYESVTWVRYRMMWKAEQQQPLPNHTALVRYRKWVEAHSSRTSKRNDEATLLHSIDCAQGAVMLTAVTFSETGFVIEGRAPNPEAAIAYGEHLKGTLKGVVIHAKQDDARTHGATSFRVEGKYTVPADVKTDSHRTSD